MDCLAELSLYPYMLAITERTLKFMINMQLIISLLMVVYSIILRMVPLAIIGQLIIIIVMAAMRIILSKGHSPINIVIGYLLFYYLVILPGLNLVLGISHPMVAIMIIYAVVLTVLLLDGYLRRLFFVVLNAEIIIIMVNTILETMRHGEEIVPTINMLVGGTVAGIMIFYGVWVFKDKFINLNKDIYHNSVRDSLTEAFNGRKLVEELAAYKLLYEKENRNFSVIMIDMDNFKAINDTFGHNTGDKVLQEFVLNTTKLIRSQDTLFRYGGDEFVLLLPDCDKGFGQEICNRILNQTHEMRRSYPELGLSFSAGVCDYMESKGLGKDIMKIADQRMYEAKGAGRDTVVANI